MKQVTDKKYVFQIAACSGVQQTSQCEIVGVKMEGHSQDIFCDI